MKWTGGRRDPDDENHGQPLNGGRLWCPSMAGTEGHRFFHTFAGLEAARQLRGAWIVMDADWGGQVLLTCPVTHARCDDAALHQLHCDLISISWGSGELYDGSVAADYGSEGEKIYLFSAPRGHGIPGGMGGAANLPEPWVHQELVDKGLKDAILAVLSGSSRRLPAVRPAP